MMPSAGPRLAPSFACHLIAVHRALRDGDIVHRLRNHLPRSQYASVLIVCRHIMVLVKPGKALFEVLVVQFQHWQAIGRQSIGRQASSGRQPRR